MAYGHALLFSIVSGWPWLRAAGMLLTTANVMEPGRLGTTLVIYNPVAGRGRVMKLWPEVCARLTALNLRFDAVATTGPLSAQELAARAHQHYAAVIGVGGDGTLSEIVNGLVRGAGHKDTLPLGIIPLGNGDDFAKMLSPRAAASGLNGWRGAIERIMSGQPTPVDIGRFRGDDGGDQVRYFLNVIGVGFGAHTVKNFAAVPHVLTGFAAYAAAVLTTMVRFPVLDLRIELDAQPPFDQRTTIIAVGNGGCFGGGFWVCPQANIDDGEFDVMIAQRLNRRTILSLLPRLKRGTHVSSPRVTMSRAKRIVMTSKVPFLVEADGEMPLAPTRRLEIEVVPQRLRLLI